MRSAFRSALPRLREGRRKHVVRFPKWLIDQWLTEKAVLPDTTLYDEFIHPSRMTEDQIRLNKYRLSRRRSERKKNQQWAGRTGGLQPYGHGALYGLEADAMVWADLVAAFEEEVASYLEVDREQVVRRRLKRELVEVMKELLLQRLLQ